MGKHKKYQNTQYTQKPKRQRYNNYLKSNLNKNIPSNKIIFIQNLPLLVLDKSLLYRYEYLGQYGNIISISLFNNCAYVKFSSENEAAIAFLSMNENYVYNNYIIVTFAEFNYKKNKDVSLTEDNENINQKNEILNCIKIANIFNEDIKKCLILQCKNKRTIFPSPDKIYLNDNIMKYSRNNSEIRIKSRFDFVNHDKENMKEEENVAQKIISSFVDKDYILRNLFINKNNDNNLLKENLNLNNNILKDSKDNFNNSIISYNKNMKENKLLECDENDEELINDIDNISSFVFSETSKKCPEEIKNDLIIEK